MLNYNEITPKKIIVINDDPYEVISSHVFRKQQRKPVNQVKLKHLITGKVMEHSFHQSERVEEADVSTRPIKYLYQKPGEVWFCEANDASKRFQLSNDVVDPSQIKFLKANSIIDSIEFNDAIIGIRLPVKIDLKVMEAPPAVKGNTAQGGTKQVELETGASVQVPLFINEGDTVRINTDTGEYSERVEKARYFLSVMVMRILSV